jgi:hypothetical protein
MLILHQVRDACKAVAHGKLIVAGQRFAKGFI